MIDRKKFFDGIRSGPFSGKLNASQVQGCGIILDEWERRKLKDARQLAYILATAFHETNQAMQPVIETRQPSEDKNPTVETAIARLERAWASGRMPWVKTAYWRKDADGLSWLGRGPPQVTHKRNYARCEAELGIPFTKNPDLMLKLEHAIPVMFEGMLKGWFTGKKLSDYFTATSTDWFNARRIINATESAAKVAAIAKEFHSDLITAGA